MYNIDYNSYRSVKGFNSRIRFLVIHYTAGNFASSVAALTGPSVSAHYLVPDPEDKTYIAAGFKNLRIFNLVSEDERAWHAGVSAWAGRSNLNDTSIGIEIVNLATENQGEFIFPPYNKAQIEAVKQLIINIIQRYPDITPNNIVAHSDIAPGRKSDPGPAFPWQELYQAGIGAWYDQATQQKYLKKFSCDLPDKDQVVNKLKHWGYDITLASSGQGYGQLIRAFQLHFRPANYDGVLDAETAANLFALVEKYFPAEQPVVKEFRASWVATTLNLDWPSKQTLTIKDDLQRVAAQKQQLITLLEDAKSLNINAVIFQVKPCADAFYASRLLPWSRWLTGKLGQYPGFDPLAFAIEQAHSRGIELHAWLNPYRVSMDSSQATIAELNNSSTDSPASVYQQHPGWIKTAANRFVLDPGLPEVRNWLNEIIAELLENYDVDGIQFDDYFYSESADSPLNDAASYQLYGAGFASKGDWRRNNTYRLVTQVSQTVKRLKPQVQFGISPAGVWRNKQDDPLGSDTRAGIPCYDVAYADTRKWVLEELIDYIAPQIYWSFAQPAARYDVVAKWWAETVKSSNTKLYIGMALYKVGSESSSEPDWAIDHGVPEITRQLDLNQQLPQVAGCLLFRHQFLHQPQTQPVVEYLRQRWKEH